MGEVIRVPRRNKVLPGIFIDNLQGRDIRSVVKQHKGGELLRGGPVSQWGLGWRVTDDNEDGVATYGPMSPTPTKPNSLLKDGKFFTQSKPQYDVLRTKGDFINVLEKGATNDGNIEFASQNTRSINAAMKASADTGSVVVFPAGIYPVDDTIVIPVGARLQGALWSQIMAVGSNFGDPKKPKAVIR